MDKSDKEVVKTAQDITDRVFLAMNTLGALADRADSVEAKNTIKALLETVAEEAQDVSELV